MKGLDFPNMFLVGDQPTTCPYCGARTEILLDFSHTINQVMVHKCMDRNCGFEFVEIYKEDCIDLGLIN